jgi:hypothetical protein
MAPSLLTHPQLCPFCCAEDEEDESQEDEDESQDSEVSEDEGIEGGSEEDESEEGEKAPSKRALATMDRRAYMDAVLHTYDACIR